MAERKMMEKLLSAAGDIRWQVKHALAALYRLRTAIEQGYDVDPEQILADIADVERRLSEITD
jgi:hypothetical protein